MVPIDHCSLSSYYFGLCFFSVQFCFLCLCNYWQHEMVTHPIQVVQIIYQDGTSIYVDKVTTYTVRVDLCQQQTQWEHIFSLGLLCLPARPQECRNQETGCYMMRAKKGHRQESTQQQDWYLLLCGRKNRGCTARDLQDDLQHCILVNVCDQIVRKRLREHGVSSRHTLVGPVRRTVQLDWHLPENTRTGRSAISTLFSSHMRAGSH